MSLRSWAAWISWLGKLIARSMMMAPQGDKPSATFWERWPETDGRIGVLWQHPSGKIYKKPLETLCGAEGGTRTPMPLRAQRPERCVSTNFTTSAHLRVCLPLELVLRTCTILLYRLRPVKSFLACFSLFSCNLYQAKHAIIIAISSHLICFRYRPMNLPVCLGDE